MPNEFNSTREVIDVSGDGLENQGVDAPTAGDNALEAGIDTLNGLVISDDPEFSAITKTMSWAAAMLSSPRWITSINLAMLLKIS